MSKKLFKLPAPELGELVVARWGEVGRPVVWFPTEDGDWREAELKGLLLALGPLMAAEKIKFYAVSCPPCATWFDQTAAPWHKSWVQDRFDRWLVEQVVPAIRQDCGDTDLGFIAAGISLGAYQAFNAAAKHPDIFDRALMISGRFGLDRHMGGHWDENYYFNQPLQFLPRLGESEQLTKLHQSRFVLCSGLGRWETPEDTTRVAAMLNAKGIPQQVELWGIDAERDWGTWREKVPELLARLAD